MDKKFYDLLEKRINKESQATLDLIKDVTVSSVVVSFLAEISKMAKNDVLKGEEKYVGISKFKSCFDKLDSLISKNISEDLLVDIFVALLFWNYLSAYLFWKFVSKESGIENMLDLENKEGGLV